ncbi:MAG TPA: Calx-beta domain-containing protein [Fibrella sp.]
MAAQPGSNVTINLSSSDTTEGVLRVGGQPATNNLQSLTFTPANFNTVQTVTVAGVNDPDDDGNVNFNIVVGKPISSDTNYSGLPARNIGFINVDNDAVGFTITPYIGLRTSESGGTATFTVRLNSRPKANVTIALSTPFTNEIAFSPTSLTFTSANFNTAQTVTVRGLDDQVIDGNRSWVIVTAPATSTDAQYNGLNPGDPAGTNTDNDSESIVLTPTSQLVREGQSVTVSVRLLGTPTSNVIVPLSVTPTNQVVLDKSQLTFTPANANTPQIVRVTALADGTNDGNVPVTLTAGPPVSADQRFNGAAATRTATITVLDVVANPAVNIGTPSTTVLNESGTTATIDVTLSSQPAANVTINVTSSDTSEGAVTPTTLTFTPANFNTAQTVTVTGVDDPDDDGNVNFTVNFSKPVSTDPNYSGLSARTLGFLNVDNDTAGFTVTPSTGNRLQTTEGGGTDTFTIRLNSRPRANVTITLSTPFTKEVSFTPTTLTFTSLNFNTAQTVTVRGLDDTVQDGNRSFVIVTNPATSTDAQYNGLNPGDVAGFNADNETFGYTFSPGILVVEEGKTATFSLRLNLAPTAPVRVPISSGDTTEVRVNTTALIFTPQNFATPQNVILTGVDDNLRDGDVTLPNLLIIGNAISSDPNYNGQFARNVPGTVIDTDVPGVIVNAATQLTTTEAGGQATFTVALQTAPQGNNTVTINVLSSDTTEATVAPPTLTFNASNFDIEQTVTVTGVDDGIRDGDQNYRIVLRVATTSDPDYVGLSVPAVNGRNRDNGGAGILISPADGLTTDEEGATTSFDVRLINRPSNNVTVTLRSSDPTEGVLLQGNATSQPVANNTLTLTFTNANFDTVQTVTVRGVDDSIVDGDINYAITSRLSSTDTNFNMVGASALIVNLDSDTAGINVTAPANGFVLAEGSRGTFTIALTTQPTGKVVVRLRSTDTKAATVNYSAITFFPNAPVGTVPPGELFTQWNRPATVIITAVADGVVDGDQPWKIDISRDAGFTEDEFYKTVDPEDVTGITTDVNIAGVTVIGPTSITTSETDVQTNTTTSFTINLRSKPLDNVVVPLSISDRSEAALRVPGSTGFALGGSLTFTPDNFSVPQTVLVRGLNDAEEDGDQSYFVVIGPTISRSAPFNAIDPADIAGVNKDDEDLTAPTVTITSPTDGAIVNFLQSIEGTADDAASTGNGLTSGIATVKVRLFRVANADLKQTEGYYNPTTKTFDVGNEDSFVAAKHQILARYNAATKVFSALLPLTGGSVASGTYRVKATATDKSSKANETVSAPVTFTVDTKPPTVTITAPVAGTFSTPPQVQGVAQDDPGGTGIDTVSVKVFRAANVALGNTAGFLLPDGTFSDTDDPENLLPAVLELPGAAGDVNFTFDFPALGAGQYTITVVAQDVAGNITTTAGVTITLRNVSGAEDFLIGQTYLFSLPYANTDEVGATVRPNEAFNVLMFDPATNEQRYLLSRFNPLTSSYETLDESAQLRRGEGYLIRPLTANVRILRETEDDSRKPLNETITTWTYTLRRNASASSTDPNNGFNLIGDPFHPDEFLAADWQNATFFDGATPYQGVAAAAAAGLVDSRLFTLNSATGAFEPTNGNLEVFEGYFVRTFKDNVQVRVRAISASQ